jgi:hypothetical protein
MQAILEVKNLQVRPKKKKNTPANLGACRLNPITDHHLLTLLTGYLHKPRQNRNTPQQSYESLPYELLGGTGSSHPGYQVHSPTHGKPSALSRSVLRALATGDVAPTPQHWGPAPGVPRVVCLGSVSRFRWPFYLFFTCMKLNRVLSWSSANGEGQSAGLSTDEILARNPCRGSVNT